MKIATFNVKNKSADLILRGKSRMYQKFTFNNDLILQANPDVIGLQEVTKSQLEDLLDLFNRKYEIYGEFRHSIGITDECCPIMVKRGIGIVKNANSYSLSSNIYNIGERFSGSIFPRVATEVYVDDGIFTYHLTNTHVDNSLEAQRKTFKDNGPLEQILYGQGIIESDINIQLGDFNSEINGLLKDYCARNFLTDATESLGKTYKPLNKSIDHILYSDDADITDLAIYRNSGSDHALIMADIKPRINL